MTQFEAGDYGWSSGAAPAKSAVASIAAKMGRSLQSIDDYGYESNIISAVAHQSTKAISYVESLSKRKGDFEDVTIKVHLRTANGEQLSCDIESYNPFFGCHIEFFSWIEDMAVLIYSEKHNTYATRLNNEWPPKFIEIESRWRIEVAVLAYLGYNEKNVRRLSFPQLQEMPHVTLAEAERDGYLPGELA